MKKTLIAVAALAATASFAQVTLTGNIDFAGANVTGTQYGAKGSTVSTTVGTASTSTIKITAMEDLGGGMKIGGMYELDPRSFANDSFAVANNVVIPLSGGSTPSTSTPNGVTATGLARGEAFLSFSGGFGDIKLGSPNAITLGGAGASSPLGTGVGSGYAPASKTMFNTTAMTRYDRSIRYDTPNMSGLTASVLYAPGNDEAGVAAAATATATGGNVARLMPNNRETTEFGLSYSNGPLNVAYAYISQKAQANNPGWYEATASGSLTPIVLVATKGSILGANYKIANTTLYAGLTSGDAWTSTTSVTGNKGSRIAIKHSVGLVDLIAQSTKQKATTAAGVVTDAKVTGLRADYNLSKTAAAYVGYESWDTGAAATADSATKGDRKITSVGLRKSF